MSIIEYNHMVVINWI